jgi:hypothetical protein
MIDDLRPDEGLSELDGPTRSARRTEKSRPLADREVPLGNQEIGVRLLSPSIHAWLDGELPEASVRKGSTARDVEFWKGLNAELSQTRRMMTPLHLESQIMAALPQSAPQVITPWFRREFVVTPVTALAIVGVTAAVTFAIMALAR